jgi:hypothetical protein
MKRQKKGVATKVCQSRNQRVRCNGQPLGLLQGGLRTQGDIRKGKPYAPLRARGSSLWGLCGNGGEGGGHAANRQTRGMRVILVWALRSCLHRRDRRSS